MKIEGNLDRVEVGGIEYTYIEIDGAVGYRARAIGVYKYRKVQDTYVLTYSILDNINGIPVISTERCFELGMFCIELRAKFDGPGYVALDLSDSSFVNVLDMESMFEYFKQLTGVKFPSKSKMPKKLKIADRMFYSCIELHRIDLSDLDTSHLESALEMFSCCSKLESVDIRMDSGNDINMDNMFSQCKSLSDFKLSMVDLSYITNMQGMFEDCSSLLSATFKEPNNTRHMDRNASSMFFECPLLTGFDFKYFGKCDLDVSHMLSYCTEPLMLKGLEDIRFCNQEYMCMSPPIAYSPIIKDVDIANFIRACNNDVGRLFEASNMTDKLNQYNMEYIKGTHHKYSVSQSSIVGDEICLLGVDLIDHNRRRVNSLIGIVSYLRLACRIEPRIIIIDDSISLTLPLNDEMEFSIMQGSIVDIDIKGMNGDEAYEYLVSVVNKTRMFGNPSVIVVKNLEEH